MSGHGTGNEIPGQHGGGGNQLPGAGSGTGWEVPGGGGQHAAAPAHHGGGGFGGFLHSVGHWIGHQSSVGGHTLLGVGSGLYHIGKSALPSMQEIEHPLRFNTKSAEKQYGEFFAHPIRNYQETAHGKYGHEAAAAALSSEALTKGQYDFMKGAAQHPGRNVTADLLALAPLLHVSGSVAAHAGGFDLGAAREIHVPGSEEPTYLHASHNAGLRLIQHAYDKVLQKGLDRSTSLLEEGRRGKISSRVAGHAMRRAGGAAISTSRITTRMREAAPFLLGKAAKQLGKLNLGDGHYTSEDVGDGALGLVLENALPREAAVSHRMWAEGGLAPAENTAWQHFYEHLDQMNLLRRNAETGKVEINPEVSPELHQIGELTRGISKDNEGEVVRSGLMSEQDATARRNAPNLVRAGVHIPGTMARTLKQALDQRDRLGSMLEDALQKDEAYMRGEGPKTVEGYRVQQGPDLTPGGVKVPGTFIESPFRDRIVRLRQAYEAAEARVQKHSENAALQSQKPEPYQRTILREIAKEVHDGDRHAAEQELQTIDAIAHQWAIENNSTPADFYRQHVSEVIRGIPGEGEDALNQIDPFHSFEEDKVNRNLRAKLNPRTQENGAVGNPGTVDQNGIHFAGQVTPEAWVQRVLNVMESPEAIDHASHWYEHFEPLFRKEFPKEVADKVIRAFAVSQANASPSAGVGSSLAALTRLDRGEEVGSIGSVVADNIEKALKGEHIDSKVAAKLSDFIDALRGSTTRTWMGHAAEGGAPAPIDIWGLRDLGYVDKKIASKGRDARLQKLRGVDVNQLKIDNPGSASGARYERAAEQYHAITDHLNSIHFNGRSDWTPAQTQALGWASIQKYYGQVPEDLVTAITKGRSRAEGILKRGDIQKIVDEVKQPDGGATLHADLTPDTSTAGFNASFAHFEERIPADQFTAADLAKYVRDHKDILRNPGNRVGIWHNPDDGLVYLDVSRTLPTREEALAFARENGQLAVFDRAAALERGDWENAFPESGLSVQEADNIKAAARAKAEAPQRYQNLVDGMARELGLNGRLTARDRALTEDHLHEWADVNPDHPLAQKFKALYRDKQEMEGMKVTPPDMLFQHGEVNPRAVEVAAENYVAKNGGTVESYHNELTSGIRDGLAKPLSSEELNSGSERLAESASLRAGARSGEPGAAQEEAPAPGEHPLGAAGGGHGGQREPDNASDRLSQPGTLHQEFTEPPKDSFEAVARALQRRGVKILGAYDRNAEHGRMFIGHEAQPGTILHESLHAALESLPKILKDAVMRHYGEHELTGQLHEKFVEDMAHRVQSGEPLPPALEAVYQGMVHQPQPGEGYVPGYTSDVAGGGTPGPSGSVPPKVGAARSPIRSQEYRGVNLMHGARGVRTLNMIAAHLRRINKYLETTALRQHAVHTAGHQLFNPGKDVLVRDLSQQIGRPGSSPKISADVESLLGRRVRFQAQPAEAVDTETGALAGLQAFAEELFPGAESKDSFDHLAAGTPAPEGYKWVDRGAVPNISRIFARPDEQLRAVRYVDALNSAVTAATVYFKLGHIFTRVFTDAATNILQGSLTPMGLKDSVGLWNDLSTLDRWRAYGAVGTNYYEALPASGETMAARFARSGARVFGHFVDVPFRFNSLAYEFRRIGVNTAEDFSHALDVVEGKVDATPAERAKYVQAMERADREAIAYDRMNEFEKRVLTRAVWFYPWVKGSTVFTFRTMFEHPFKANLIGTLGQQGMEQQSKDFPGGVPSYEYGLIKLMGGKNPLVTDVSTFSPFATAGQLMQIPEHMMELSGNLNPALAGLQTVATQRTPTGVGTNSPLLAGLEQMFSPSPEAQIVGQLFGENSKMFPRHPAWPADFPGAEAIWRMLFGPAMPRRVNPPQLTKDEGLEKAGPR